MTFTFVWWPLFALLPLPWLIQRLPQRTQDKPMNSFQQPPPFAQRWTLLSQASPALPSIGAPPPRWLSALLYTTWFFWVLSIARPTWIGEPAPLHSSGRDFWIAVDLSDSMSTEDMQLDGQAVSRLDLVKALSRDFLLARLGDRVGLILFGTDAYVQAPITYDLTTVNQLLQEAPLQLAGPKTAIGDAIGLAIKQLQSLPNPEKVVLLITDGANTAGHVSPQTAAQYAQQAGIRIYTLGIGADEMVVQRLFSLARINPSADLDEALLQTLAQSTQGRYFRAKSAQDLEQIYQALDSLEPVAGQALNLRPRSEWFYLPLSVALLGWTVLALYAWQSQRRIDKTPHIDLHTQG